MNEYWVYILASGRNGTLYIGMTNDMARRIYEHKLGSVDGFTKQYGVYLLVYVERSSSVQDAIAREKQLKQWNRKWKLALIEKFNPTWRDLSKE